MTLSRVLTDLGSHTSWKVSYSHIFKAQSPLEPCCSYPFHSSPRFQKILFSTTVEWKLKLQPCMHTAADVATDMLAVTFLFTHWELGSRCNFAIKLFFQINDRVLLCWVQSIHVCVHACTCACLHACSIGKTSHVVWLILIKRGMLSSNQWVELWWIQQLPSSILKMF